MKFEKFFNVYRFKIFFCMFFAYVFFYFSRKTLVFIFPLMINDLSFSIYDVGVINSIFYIIYAFGKILGAIITDRYNFKYLMFFGLILTGLFNVFISFSKSILIISFFWLLNAFFQGWGWPPITKQLTYWYKNNERGLWWSFFSISHNIGGAIIPIVISLLSVNFIWRFNFFIIGFFCVFMGFFFIYILKNYRVIPNHSFVIKHYNFTDIFNKKIFVLCVCYFFIYLIKTALYDWLILYMVNQKEYILISASFSIFYFELGGIFGILFSGWLSDKFFTNRLVFLFICVLFLFFVSFIYYIIPTGYIYFEFLIIFFVGFFLFSPQMLVGLIASETVNKNVACTSNSLVGMFAYIGAALAGYPFSFIINISWNFYFIIILFFEIFLIFLLYFSIINCYE